MAKMESGLVGGQENEVDADEYPLFFFFFFFMDDLFCEGLI
jgi:hypothetical protein